MSINFEAYRDLWIKFYNLKNLNSFFLSLLTIIFPILILMVFLKSKELIFYNPFDIKILVIDFLLISLIILFTRSFFITALLFYFWMLAPFISYYFLRRGILYSDIINLNEFIYFLGTPLTLIFSFFLLIILLISIYNNFKNFSKIFLFLQIICFIFAFILFKSPNIAFNTLYKDTVLHDFNISASFRFIGVNHAFLYSILDTRLFEKSINNQKLVNEYLDFRAFNSELYDKKNLHIIMLESYLDLQDFDNLKFDKSILDDEWKDWKEKYSISALSPVSGGGSAQAEFEILCGVKSTHEYGAEFNRLGTKSIPCLPNYLKKFGYSTFASQPIYGSFFNVKKAYESLGFDKIWLAENLDMSKTKKSRWLSDESFFNQHFKLIEPYLKKDQPILNYLFAVGCHSLPDHIYTDVVNNDNSLNVTFNTSLRTQHDLNCYMSTSNSVIKYIRKINEIDSNNIFLILPDHLPSIKSPMLEKKGLNQFTSLEIKDPLNGSASVNSNFSNVNGHINYGYLIHDNKVFHEKNMAYYEIPEILINIISDGKLCTTISCWSENLVIIFKRDSVLRDDFNNFIMTDKEKIKDDYQRKLNLSLIKQSNFGE